MFVISNFIIALAHVIGLLIDILYWVIIIRALISWVNPDPFNPIVQFLMKVTEPVLEPIRRRLPASLRFGIDISPLIAIFALIFLRWFIVGSLRDLALRFA